MILPLRKRPFIQVSEMLVSAPLTQNIIMLYVISYVYFFSNNNPNTLSLGAMYLFSGFKITVVETL